jgi:cytochrome c553
MGMKKLVLVVCLVGIFGCGKAPDLKFELESTPAIVAKGRELAKGLAACGFCHGETPRPEAMLSGGRELHDIYGAIPAPNVTASSDGLKNWSIEETVRGLRNGLRPTGETFYSNLHAGFEWMADEDALALAAYIKSLPPVRNPVERREPSFIERNTTGFFAATQKEVSGFIPKVSREKRLEFGQYLVDNVARCGVCHSAPGGVLSSGNYLGGGEELKLDGETKVAPDISARGAYGLGGWSEAQIVTYLKTGETPDGRQSDPDFCPYPFYGKATEQDLALIAEYLKRGSENAAKAESESSTVRKVGPKEGGKQKPKRSDAFQRL